MGGFGYPLCMMKVSKLHWNCIWKLHMPTPSSTGMPKHSCSREPRMHTKPSGPSGMGRMRTLQSHANLHQLSTKPRYLWISPGAKKSCHPLSNRLAFQLKICKLSGIWNVWSLGLIHQYHAKAIYISPHLRITGLNALPSILCVRPEFLCMSFLCEKDPTDAAWRFKSCLKGPQITLLLCSPCFTWASVQANNHSEAPSMNSNVKCNRLAVVPYSYRIFWPILAATWWPSDASNAIPGRFGSLSQGQQDARWWKRKSLHRKGHRMLANSQSFGQLGWGTACPKINLPKGSHRSRSIVPDGKFPVFMAPPGRLRGIPWQHQLKKHLSCSSDSKNRISPRNASVCSSRENQDLRCLEKGCFAAPKKGGLQGNLNLSKLFVQDMDCTICFIHTTKIAKVNKIIYDLRFKIKEIDILSAMKDCTIFLHSWQLRLSHGRVGPHLRSAWAENGAPSPKTPWKVSVMMNAIIVVEIYIYYIYE